VAVRGAARKQRSGSFGSLPVCGCGCPVECCPLVVFFQPLSPAAALCSCWRVRRSCASAARLKASMLAAIARSAACRLVTWAVTWGFGLERAKGIEPSWPAWKAAT